MRSVRSFMCLVLVSCTSFVLAGVSSELDKSGASGIAAYNIGNLAVSVPLLEIAATAGDSEAQYYLGEIERHKTMLMTPAAQRWYEHAAKQGHLYSMLRLVNAKPNNPAPEIQMDRDSIPLDYWRDRAFKVACLRAKSQDGEAMEVLYYLTGDISWLKRSAKSGFAPGQFQLAKAYSNGEGTFFTYEARDRAIEKWVRTATESGHGPARNAFIQMLSTHSDLDDYHKWRKIAAEEGDLDSTYEYAKWLGSKTDDDNFVAAYGLTLIVAEAESAVGGDSRAINRLGKLAEKMTPEHIREGEVFAQEWKKTHPPLSRFLPKYGY